MGNGTFVYISRIDELGFRLICYNKIESGDFNWIFYGSCDATLTLLINVFNSHGHKKHPKIIPNNRTDTLMNDVLMAFMPLKGGGKCIFIDLWIQRWAAKINFQLESDQFSEEEVIKFPSTFQSGFATDLISFFFSNEMQRIPAISIQNNLIQIPSNAQHPDEFKQSILFSTKIEWQINSTNFATRIFRERLDESVSWSKLNVVEWICRNCNRRSISTRLLIDNGNSYFLFCHVVIT